MSPTHASSGHRARVLVVDDEPSARRGIARALGRRHYEIVECGGGREALERLSESAIDLVLLDLRMEDLDGRTTLDRIVEREEAAPPVIMVTADSQLSTALDCLRAGATDFLAKPYEIEELRWVVRRTLEGSKLRRQNAELRSEVERLAGDGTILGESPAMVALLDAIDRVAPTEAGVLIRGETGTGKELVARRIHRRSPVAEGPFVALNCAAVPETLIESELFGHRKGAFTGADRDRLGRLREAHGGTLFLDEVGDMPLAAQAKLLRVLQERRVEPLGGGASVEVSVRVLAATHRDLEAMGREGTFRQDLYFRLRVVELLVPPLRERGDDVLLLARSFLARAAGRPCGLEAETVAALRAHDWPGNVRELENAMQRAAIFCRGESVVPDDLPAELRAVPSRMALSTDGAPQDTESSPRDCAPQEFAEAKRRMIESFEFQYFTGLLERHSGNVSQAAREAGLHRQNLQKKLRSLGLEAKVFRRET